MACLKKVRRADISAKDREMFERIGEPVLSYALAEGVQTLPLGAFSTFDFRANRISILAYLTERRDIAERVEQRMELVEWAVLIFVVIGTLTEIATLFADLAVLHQLPR